MNISTKLNHKNIDLTPFLLILSIVKILHWKSKSKSHHETFGDVYELLSDKIDEFVECYMGSSLSMAWNCTDIPIEIPEIENDIRDFASSVDSFIEDATAIAAKNTALLSLVDDMANICYRAIYLLKMS